MTTRQFFLSALAFPLVFVAGSAPAAASANPENDWDYLLSTYVVGDHFAYRSLLETPADMERFDRFLAWQAEADVAAMPKANQIAFYINAYNACCVKAILDHYPVHTPNDVPGFFDKLMFKVGGENLTISGIEYDRLIANYKDMRAHFAVVCADRGCLPLKASAWQGETLDAELDAAATRFVGNEKQFKIDPATREVQISKIFEWYGPKFTQDPVRPADKPEKFLMPWLSPEAKALLESGDYKLKIIEWDWTLNESLKR